ncbi:MAG: TIGR03936 family radical SAM-associated protein [Planctomycetes bacterium]|nr:TIGR03936 family radical SAM-associated protein [Planctomycetota bacterium]
MLVKFRIWGNLRFLSHAETLKVFQRACVRAGINVRYSEGFNPRPKLSLPLPRSVGVESDDELLALRVVCKADVAGQVSQIERGLSGQLPDGCEVHSVSVAGGGKAPRPRSAVYVLAVRPGCLGDELKDRIEHLLASETVVVRRQVDARASRFKDVDVRGFVRSVELDAEGVLVECEISSAGSIRVEEILELLGLDGEKLSRPVRRTSVRWRQW